MNWARRLVIQHTIIRQMTEIRAALRAKWSVSLLERLGIPFKGIVDDEPIGTFNGADIYLSTDDVPVCMIFAHALQTTADLPVQCFDKLGSLHRLGPGRNMMKMNGLLTPDLHEAAIVSERIDFRDAPTDPCADRQA